MVSIPGTPQRPSDGCAGLGSSTLRALHAGHLRNVSDSICFGNTEFPFCSKTKLNQSYLIGIVDGIIKERQRKGEAKS